MSSDNQYTALGPAIVGFQTHGTNIDRGAEIAGNSLGILGHCDGGNGVHGQSGSVNDSGVWGENTNGGFGVSGSTNAASGARGVIAGVWGSNTGAGAGVRGTSGSGDGIFGEGRNGVHGHSGSATDSGVWGENNGRGFGVSGFSPGGVGVWGSTTVADTLVDDGEGVLGDGKNGVHGRSRSPSDSGVWGENTGSGFGVSGSTNSGAPKAGVWGHNFGSGFGVRGDSSTGEGVFGQGKNGVHGQSNSATDSGVWGENTGRGAGVAGSGASGYGGQFTGGFAPLYLTPSASTGHPTSGDHKRGEFYVDNTGSLFYCKVDGVPGTWAKLA